MFKINKTLGRVNHICLLDILHHSSIQIYFFDKITIVSKLTLNTANNYSLESFGHTFHTGLRAPTDYFNFYID